MKTPIHKIPVLLRGGTILPKRERVRRASTLMLRDPYTLVVAVDGKVQIRIDVRFFHFWDMTHDNPLS